MWEEKGSPRNDNFLRQKAIKNTFQLQPEAKPGVPTIYLFQHKTPLGRGGFQMCAFGRCGRRRKPPEMTTSSGKRQLKTPSNYNLKLSPEFQPFIYSNIKLPLPMGRIPNVCIWKTWEEKGSPRNDNFLRQKAIKNTFQLQPEAKPGVPTIYLFQHKTPPREGEDSKCVHLEDVGGEGKPPK
ncbi:MAG: hypothetical protein IPN29_06835 [Saprospiraceae bacterium]|nr:hypothetical protein [Saprospiraceae bacterium]